MTIERVNQNVIREYTSRVQPAAAQAPAATRTGRPEDAQPTSSRRPDEISLSVGSRDLQRMKEAVAAAPDVREDRVNELKQQIANGTYQINYRAVARKMAGVINFE